MRLRHARTQTPISMRLGHREGATSSGPYLEFLKRSCYRLKERSCREGAARAGTWMSSFLSACSTTTARPAWSSAALAGRLQRWRSHSMFRYKSFGHKHRTRTIYKSALWTDGTSSSKARDTGSRLATHMRIGSRHANGLRIGHEIVVMQSQVASAVVRT